MIPAVFAPLAAPLAEPTASLAAAADATGPLSGEVWRDALTLVCVVIGAVFAFAAGLGILRFRDLLGRLHAQSKPQTAGLIFMLVGLALQHPQWPLVLSLVPVIVFQFLTTPAAAIVLARGGYRTKHADRDGLYLDELAADVELAEAEAQAEGAPGDGRE